MSAFQPIDPLAFIQVIWTEKAIAYALVSLSLYNFCLTFNDQVKHIWPRKWNLGKILFLVARYIPVVWGITIIIYHNLPFRLAAPDKACYGLAWLYMMLELTAVESAEISFLLCLYAIMGIKRRHWVFGLLILCFSVPSACLNIFMIASIKVIPIPKNPGFPFDWCLLSTRPGVDLNLSFRVHVAGFSLLLASTTCMFVLGLGVIIARYRHQEGGLLRGIRLSGGLHYGSAFAYHLPKALRVFTLTTFLTRGYFDSWYLFGLQAQVVLLPIVACSLLEHIQKWHGGPYTTKGALGGEGEGETRLSTIRFNHNAEEENGEVTKASEGSEGTGTTAVGQGEKQG